MPEHRDELLKIHSLADLVSICIALGASRFGGPLSIHETKLVRCNRRITPAVTDQVATAIRSGSDPLGEALVSLRPVSVRRLLGAFYTPNEIVQSMVHWVLAKKPARLIDPGCGSGRFVAEAIRTEKKLPVVAIDIDPLATLVCRATLASLGARRAVIINDDYLTLSIDQAKGRGLSAFVGNPPYVRHHDLSPKQKEWAKKAADRLGFSISGLAGLHVYFFLATFAQARPLDIGCFITSAEWLDVGYGGVLRDALLNGMGGNALHLLDRKSVVFDDAMTTAVITCFEISRCAASMRLRLVRSRKVLDDLGGGRAVRRDRLANAKRWTPLFYNAPRRLTNSKVVPLGSLVRVSRGVATGANSFFTLSKEEAVKRGLLPYTVPVLTSAQDVFDAEGVIEKAQAGYVLLAPPKGLDLSDPRHSALADYVQEGRRRRVSKAYLCRHRSPWWWIGEVKAAPIVATYMARQAPAFALNPHGFSLLNVLHGLFPKNPMTKQMIAGLVTYLNRYRNNFRGLGRVYQGGLEKFEPREMEAIPVPPAERLNEYTP